MVKFLNAIFATTLILTAVCATADHHSNGPIGYGISYILKVNDPAAIAGVMTEVRTTDLGKDNPSSVFLNQVVAGGTDGATHTIGVFYQSAADIDKSEAMNRAMNVGQKIGPVFQEAAESLQVVMWTMLRTSYTEGAVTSENPVSMGYVLNVTDPAAFMAAFDPLWESVTKSFPGTVSFGASLANGESPGTHWVTFSANNMETLLAGVQAMQSSPEMAAYTQKAGAFRTVVSESFSRRALAFPQAD